MDRATRKQRKREERAKRQHFSQANVPAPRGDILDAAGAPFVESRSRVRINIAPVEMRLLLQPEHQGQAAVFGHSPSSGMHQSA